MEKWLRSYITSFLPSTLELNQLPSSKGISREISLWSIGLVGLLAIATIITYLMAFNRFNPATRSLNLHPVSLVIAVIGWACAFVYYEIDIKKAIVWLLPGIIVGGGFFLGLVSFTANLAFPMVVLHANMAALSTVLATNMLNFLGVLDRFKGLEAKLIMFGSAIIFLANAFITYLFMISFVVHAPTEIANPLGFYGNTIVICTIVIILMSIFSLFHLREMEKYSSEKISQMDKLHLAANSLFVVFMLYLFFLGLFSILRRGK